MQSARTPRILPAMPWYDPRRMATTPLVEKLAWMSYVLTVGVICAVRWQFLDGRDPPVSHVPLVLLGFTAIVAPLLLRAASLLRPFLRLLIVLAVALLMLTAAYVRWMRH
jgi:hypothetical protein